VLVCGGVLLIPRKEKQPGSFNIPYVNGQFLYPLIIALAITLFAALTKNYFSDLFHFDFSNNEDYVNKKATFMDLATPKISIIIFWIVCIILAIATLIKKYSLIPLMGVTTCLYLLTGMTKSNWAWFLSWLAVGLILYFLYGFNKSKLAVKQ
jgi:hypothetical protein